MPRGYTEGKARRKTTILVWIELCRKMCLLTSPHAKKQKPKKPQKPTWNYAQTLYYTSYQSFILTVPRNGQYPRLVGCLQNPLHKHPLHPEASGFLWVGYKNRTSVINRRVLNTFYHWQGFRKFHSFIMLYLLLSYLQFYFLFFFFFFFCWVADFPFSIELNSGVWAGTSYLHSLSNPHWCERDSEFSVCDVNQLLGGSAPGSGRAGRLTRRAARPSAGAGTGGCSRRRALATRRSAGCSHSTAGWSAQRRERGDSRRKP